MSQTSVEADLQSKSFNATAASGMSYAAVDLSSVDFTPPTPFRGIVVSVGGNVIIKGVNGVNSPAMELAPGVYPLGGSAIIKTNTTATIAAAIF